MSQSSDLDARKAKLDEARRRLLAKRLQGQQTAVKDDHISPRADKDPVPLSYTQQRFWFLEQLNPGAPTYNMHEAWRVRGPLDLAALERALNRVAGRQAVLRTAIGPSGPEDDTPVQHITPEIRIAIPCRDLSGLDDAAQTAALQEMGVSAARRPFDLSAVPLLRLEAARLTADDHALFLTVHHIISDEYANDLFWRDLNGFYQVEIGRAAKPNLPDLAIQYDDFTAWQIEWLKEGEEARQLAYWQERLAGDADPLELPFDRPRPPRQTYRGGFERREFNRELLDPLTKLSQETGTTPFMVFMAAFQAILSRYGRQNDIWVGTPIANRQREEVRQLMGLFLNTIVLRSRLDDTTTFRQLLEQVKRHALDGLAYQDVPFERVVEALKPRRDPSIHPLFQVMFVYSPIAEGSRRQLAELAFEEIPVDGEVSKFDLTLFVGSNEREIEAAYEYNADLFDRATIARLLEHLELFLGEAAKRPDVPLADMPFLTAAEQAQITADQSITSVPASQFDLLHDYFAHHAAAQPEREAVWTAAGTMSYGALDAQANQLAHFLQQRGVGPETCVGVMAERRPEMVIAILGILKAGGAYVPLDPAYPAERLAIIAGDTDLKLLLTSSGELADRFESLGVETVNLGRFDYQRYPTNRPESGVTAANLAYVIFTSGSTGRPKGVMVTHGNIVHSTTARFEFYPRPAEKFLLLSSFAFDSSMVGIFWTLCQGGTLLLPGADRHQDVLYLADTIEKEGVTHLLALPSLYQLLLTESQPGQLNPLNTVMVAGEACHPDLVQTHYQRLPDTSLYNEYGPTEGTVWSHAYRFPADFAGPAVPIGRPIPGVTHLVVDDRLNPVPLGVAGELLIGGRGVTRGYLNRPELTAEKFIVRADPNIPDQTTRFYRSGDLVRLRPDGNVIFLGRVDDQVKIRGFRIELGEIEAAVTALPDITEAIVIAYNRAAPGDRPDKRLAAYVSADGPLDIDALKRQLGQRLPGYMIPAVWQQLDEIPRTPNGKVDRRRLPDPVASEQTGPVSEGAVGDVEGQLAAIWQDVLRLPNVGRNDNFFDLGGDSIIGIQIVARARRVGLQLKPRHLFEHQTIAELATAAADAVEPLGEQGVITGTFDLSPIQSWFFEQKFADPNRWNQSLWLEPRRWEAGDEIYLAAAADYLLQQHDALRLTFSKGADGRWRQTLPLDRAGRDPILKIVDLGATAPTDQEAAVARSAADLAAEIDLTCGELMRGGIYLLGNQQPPRIFLTIHHLAVDGVSWGPLLEDWETAFKQLKDNRPVVLPPKTTSVKSWADRLKVYGQKPAVQAETDRWLTHFGSEISDRLISGRFPACETKRFVQTLSEQETEALLTTVHSPFNTTINDVLLTALVRAAAATFNLSQLSILLEGHGREAIVGEELDVSRTVGWFTTQYPVRLDIQGQLSPSEQLKGIKEQLRAVPNNGIGYGVLRSMIDDSALNGRTEPALTFNYLGQMERSLLASDFFELNSPLTPLIGDENHRPHGLGLMAYVLEGRFHAVFDCHPSQIEEGLIERLASNYRETLRDLIQYCLDFQGQEKTASDFDLVEFDDDSFGNLADLLGRLQ